MRSLDWDDLRFFLAVATAGSLSAAARDLRVNTTTVLRRIANLEEALSSRLFDRLRSGYTLTPDGARLMESLAPVDQKLSSLQRDFQSDSDGSKGLVKLAAEELVLQAVLVNGLADFTAAHPEIELSLLSDSHLSGGGGHRQLNPMRDVDVAVRTARPTQGDMLVRKIGDLAYGLYAAPELAKKHTSGGHISSPAELHDTPIVGFAPDDPPHGPVWFLSRIEKTAQVTARSSSAASRMEMAAQGLGIAALPCIMADGNKALRRLAGPELVGAMELWLMARRDLAQLVHVRLVMDFVISQCQSQRAGLSGQV
jgi:DNA-binding transcriptional LysR family regulator